MTDRYANTFPAISTSENWLDRVIMQGHADYCQDHGHVFDYPTVVDYTFTSDEGMYVMCARCGVGCLSMSETLKNV